ncbi:pterin-4-alpha-carbinolamine dehydratase [Allokutzneria sp. A3M-2-11 16]|uniref:VOC family protein n=1 Tax=Allokutzneria sp. A3M-2-11 16 TaxID=2962043 RepID=UPI0020B77D81|nr:VOC family protein [Allokutzneria sp. A3M-2-11 16]MCP3802938.1 pterin-4-alpha-carbinolamine dehydratase [Allokutzneria sp. A3M-2-11 16]
MTQIRLRRTEISAALADTRWRFVLGSLRASVAVTSLTEAAEVAARLAPTGDSLALDLRRDRVALTIQSDGWVSADDVDQAKRIADLVELGSAGRSEQVVEIAIDAMDIARVRSFWRAILAYTDEPGAGPEDGVVDPLGQGPSVWFQRMTEPRPQRNRIHFDVAVPHDEAKARIAAALEAGGTLIDDEAAPAFWVLADPEGNEACVTTWQGRD